MGENLFSTNAGMKNIEDYLLSRLLSTIDLEFTNNICRFNS